MSVLNKLLEINNISSIYKDDDKEAAIVELAALVSELEEKIEKLEGKTEA